MYVPTSFTVVSQIYAYDLHLYTYSLAWLKYRLISTCLSLVHTYSVTVNAVKCY